MKACLVVDNYYTNNRIFDLDDEVSNRDNCLYFFHSLKREFTKKGIDLSTQDINSPELSEIVIYNEMPHEMPKEENINKSYLFIFESELIKPENWDKNKHKYFNKIFTWNDNIVDNKKYFKFNFSHKIPDFFDKSNFNEKKLCTLIAGNKSCKHSLELYSKRVEAIRWFESNHPDEFDFYGIGWDKKNFKGFFKKLNRFNFLRKLLFKQFPSYKGMVESKKITLSEYKYAICYENARDISGYITEKIFDCFFAGCVPVYWGAPNIEDFIPKNCYIDKRNFNTYKELYNYLECITESQYNEIISNMYNFLKSDASKQFSADFISKDIIYNILN